MQSDSIVFTRVPLPPSSNSAYLSFVRRGVVRHVCSPELVKFKAMMENYFVANMQTVKFARELLPGLPLSIDVDLGFKRERLLTKKGHFKKIDTSNRLKAMHDCFARALLIDDSAFIRVSARKHAVRRPEDEGCTVTICITDFVEKI